MGMMQSYTYYGGFQHIAEAIGYRNLDRGDWSERGI